MQLQECHHCLADMLPVNLRTKCSGLSHGQSQSQTNKTVDCRCQQEPGKDICVLITYSWANYSSDHSRNSYTNSLWALYMQWLQKLLAQTRAKGQWGSKSWKFRPIVGMAIIYFCGLWVEGGMHYGEEEAEGDFLGKFRFSWQLKCLR